MTFLSVPHMALVFVTDLQGTAGEGKHRLGGDPGCLQPLTAPLCFAASLQNGHPPQPQMHRQLCARFGVSGQLPNGTGLVMRL